MAEINNPHPAFKLFNLNLLSELTGITRDKIYKNMKSERDTLTDDEKNQIFKLLDDSLDKLKSEVNGN